MNILNEVFEAETSYERATNYIQLAKNYVDSYPSSSHGVQKDAVQNGWDVKIEDTKKFIQENWKLEFELIKVKDRIPALAMRDYGTWGMTGNLTAKDVKSSKALPPEERWARWESLAFGKESSGLLGARGQGKLVFLNASKIHSIFYDSLRADGSYRFGGTTAKENGCPINHLDGRIAKERIRKTLGLGSIQTQGTRVIIMDPIDELVESIKSGEFLSFIQESFWPIFFKYQGIIRIKYDGQTFTAEIPNIFPITSRLRETDKFKIWVKERLPIKYEGKKYFIKRICIACNLEKEVSEIFQGVACFRNSMKIVSVDFPDRSLRDKVYGYVEFDEQAERLLKEVEEPSHYKFKNKGIWRVIKDVIEDELEVFGNKKLGLGIDKRAIEARQKGVAESRAMMIFRTVTKDWRFSKYSVGMGGGGKGGDFRKKEVGVQLTRLKFPNTANIPRVDYGDKLEGFKAKIFNNRKKLVSLLYKADILSGDRLILTLDTKSVSLDAKAHRLSNPYEVEINKEKFPEKGEYRIRLMLTNKDTNDKEDRIIRRFWVNEVPPLRGPFEIRGFDFNLTPNLSPKEREVEWILEYEGSGKYALNYNTGHSAYKAVFKEIERLVGYLSEIFCFAAMQLVIKDIQKTPKSKLQDLKTEPFEVEKLLSDDKVDLFKEIAMAFSRTKGKIYEEV